MKKLTEYINEALDLEKFWDDTVTAKDKKKIQNAIYKQLSKTGTTGKFYRDSAWEGVDLVRRDIEDAFKLIKNNTRQFEVSIYPENGGYRKSKDGLSQWKEYKIDIYLKNHKTPIMGGVLNCHAAGSVNDPFDAYDMSCTIWY